MEFKSAYACSGRESYSIYQVQSLKQHYSQTKTKTSQSKLRSMCDNFKCDSLNVVHTSSQVGMDTGLYFTLVSLLFSAIYISIRDPVCQKGTYSRKIHVFT